MIIGKKFKFDAAHYLPHYMGKCKNMHGHTWAVTVELEGEVNRETGMVIDLNILSEVVNSFIRQLDHKCLNDVVELSNPTCEKLAEVINDFVWHYFNARTSKFVVHVKVQEGDGGYAIC